MNLSDKVCNDLKPGQRCFYIQRYYQGRYEELCHEHLPKSRMSVDTAVMALKSLIVKHSDWAAEFVLQSFMNKRGKKPSATNALNIRVYYPSQGGRVIRRACANSNIEGWVDELL